MRIAGWTAWMLCGLISCSEADPGGQLLSERDSYRGRVRIEVEDGYGQQAMEGELEIDRAQGLTSLQLDDGQVLLILPEGMLLERDGERSAPPATGLGPFIILSSATSTVPDGQTEVQFGESGYEVRMGDRQLRVTFADPADLNPR